MLAALLVGLLPGVAGAAAVRFSLEPGPVLLAFRAWGLGMIPIDGQFTRFHGTLTLDDRDPGACSIDVEAEAASLAMPSALMTSDALGADLLDVARYPAMRLAGTCAGGVLRATLLLHGVSRAIVLDVATTATTWAAQGLMRRAEWGMGARPLMAGPEARISVTAGLPAGFGAASEGAERRR